jgi:hypothetical protein
MAWLAGPLLVLSTLIALPAGAAAAAQVAKPACIAEQPTEAAATAMTRTCGKRVEILAERSEVAQTFVNPDGTRTVEESIEPVRVKHGSTWVPIDTTLAKTADGVVPRAAALPTTLSAGGDGPLARLRDGSNEISLSWPGTLPKPVLRGNVALYRDVLPHVDLQVTADSLGFSELLIVRDRRAAADPRLSTLKFGLATKGVNVRATPEGDLVARDKNGKSLYTAPAPLMWDASIQGAAEDAEVPAKPAPKPATTKQAKPTGRTDTVAAAAKRAVMPVTVSGNTLSLRPDAKLLADPGTKFPVYIDPAVTGLVAGGAWTSVWSKYKTSSFWKNANALNHGSTYGSAGAGRTEDCSGCSDYIIRSFFAMDVSKVKSKQILSATFRIEQRHAWTCSPKSNAKLWMTSGISSSTTWNNQPHGTAATPRRPPPTGRSAPSTAARARGPSSSMPRRWWQRRRRASGRRSPSVCVRSTRARRTSGSGSTTRRRSWRSRTTPRGLRRATATRTLSAVRPVRPGRTCPR